MVLYAATTNPGKLKEFAASAGSAGFDVLALPNLDAMAEPHENADSFMGNAEIKAVAYSLEAPGMVVFADDSGLEVEGLGGAPGVRSARFADDQGFAGDAAGSRDERNNACLVSQMEALTADGRGARFVCALALARDGVVLLRAEGKVQGEMLLEPRGENGFGYDPLFLLPALGKTMGELGTEEKWQLSHRGDAFRSLLNQLQDASF